MMTFFDFDLAALLLIQEFQVTLQREQKLIICGKIDPCMIAAPLPALYVPFVTTRPVFGQDQTFVDLGDRSRWRWRPSDAPEDVSSLAQIDALSRRYARLYGYAWGDNVCNGATLTLYGDRLEASRVAYAVKETITDPGGLVIDTHPVMHRVRLYFIQDKPKITSQDAWMITKHNQVYKGR
jgi:hypothetical protein